ncbi:MAG: tyrosine-protein phosphatase [Atopobiaceae bacterium]|nr:tyrosine-protein phosphatase [Atopobiaceae bacterium]
MSPDVHSCANVRDLGGYNTPSGLTLPHRFVRCGGTASITKTDLKAFEDWGVRRVLDLRSVGESPRITCRFSKQPWVMWENVGLYDVDISSPTMMPATSTNNYLVSSYLHMLATAEAIRNIFAFFAEAHEDECVLFHCAAGMDRTGMVAMLLLGLADVPREQIIADYCYSYGPAVEVDPVVEAYCATGGFASSHRKGDFFRYLLRTRLEAIANVYDALVQTHGSVRAYLQSCDVSSEHIDATFAHLVEE